MIPPGTPLGAVQVAIPGAPVVGLVAPAGQTVHLAQLTGWWDPPGSSGSNTQKVNDHGAWLGPAYYGARVIGVMARIDGFSPGDSMAVAQQLIRAVAVDTMTTLSVTDEAETLSAQVRQEGDPLLGRAGNRVTVSLSLLAPDSRRYGSLSTIRTGLPITTGGLSLPLVLPVSLSATTATGILTVTNVGDIDSYPAFTVSGPCAPFTIADAYGRQLAYAGTVPDGRQLIIDTAARTALLDGVANRVVTGTWLRLIPGVNQFVFRAASYDPASQLSITYRSARR